MNNTQPPPPRSPLQPVADITSAPAERVPAIRALDEDELRLLQARRRVRDLVAQLLARPIDERTNEALRDYLANDAEPALQALRELASRGPDQLRARINEILAAPRGALSAPMDTDTTGPSTDRGGDRRPRQDTP